ncbi:MAG: ABC transporter ATP-binding protein [Thermodesulfobacteriota bacterium]
MLLEIHNILKSFGGLVALSDVSFNLEEGEVVGLIGPNGSGKTTLFNVLSGFFHPDRGRIVFDGLDITGFKPHRISRLGLVRTFQIPKPLPELTVLENIRVAAFMRNRHDRAATLAAEKVLERIGLNKSGLVPSHKLTYGQKKMLELGRALATEPKILFLDEIMAGLNSAETLEVVRLLQNIKKEGQSFILIEHNMSAVLALAQRIIVLNFGMKIADGSPDEVIKSEAVIEAYLGRDQ